jgi:hypothetical protein
MNSMLRIPFAGVAEAEHNLALAALRDITSEDSIGEAIGRSENEDGALNLIFACLLPGYPGWQWNVSVGRVDGDEPTAMEADLLPTDASLVAPDWVPWSLRLADFLEAQKAAAAAGIALEGAPVDLIVVADDHHDDDDDDDLDHDDDFDDDDDDVLDLDIDGVEFEEELLPDDETHDGDVDEDEDDGDDEHDEDPDNRISPEQGS